MSEQTLQAAKLRTLLGNILLVGHGSIDPEGREEFSKFAAMVESALDGVPVVHCFLELAEPNIDQALEICVRNEASNITVVPVTLFGAGHTKDDVPEEIEHARLKYPNINFRYGRHIGVHQLMIDIIHERARQAEEAIAPIERTETGLLLVGRGSSDADANSDLYKIARIVWEQSKLRSVESCFIGITQPSLQQGIERCAKLALKNLMVIPYMVFAGVLVKRVSKIVNELQSTYPDMKMQVGEHIGPHQNLLKVLLTRLEETLSGRAYMNCETCKYKTGHFEYLPNDAQFRKKAV